MTDENMKLLKIEVLETGIYITSGIQAQIPAHIQIMLWKMVFSETKERDYLQVFELRPDEIDGQAIQEIVHSQEVPMSSAKHAVPCEKAVRAHIYVIDDETHFTMLLSSEY